MRWFVVLMISSVTWAVAQEYTPSSDLNFGPYAPSSRYAEPQIRHLQQLYQQYSERAHEYRGLAERYYKKSDEAERDHYAELAETYERKSMAVSQQLQDLETGGLNPPPISPRIERRRVQEERARIRQNEKDLVQCSLARRMDGSTWQDIPSSTGIGKFSNTAYSKIYPNCKVYPPGYYRSGYYRTGYPQEYPTAPVGES